MISGTSSHWKKDIVLDVFSRPWTVSFTRIFFSNGARPPLPDSNLVAGASARLGCYKKFHSSRMAAIPAGGSLVATTDYYRRRIGSTSSSSSCGSSEYSGEVIPHHPGLPKQDSGHWWSSFFFGKQPGMSPLTEEKTGVSGAVMVTNMSCVAREVVMQRQVSESSDAGSPTAS